jgi:hypothetical protein
MNLDRKRWMRHGVGRRRLLPAGYCFELNSFEEMMPVRKPSGWISAVDAWCRADGRGGGLTGSEGCLLGMGVVELKTELILHGPRCLLSRNMLCKSWRWVELSQDGQTINDWLVGMKVVDGATGWLRHLSFGRQLTGWTKGRKFRSLMPRRTRRDAVENER